MNVTAIYQDRDFVRVQVNVPITIRAAYPLVGEKTGEWIRHGTTVDMTGSGILVSLSEKPPIDESISLEISLPTQPPERIKIGAHPVRTLRTDDNRWKIAYRFDIISAEERDKIIGCCLVEQRRVLRLNHGIRNSE